jgi:hypothetical protein
MTEPDPMQAVRTALVDDEKIEWSETVRSVAWGASERLFAVVLSLVAGFLVTGFASQEGWVGGFGVPLAFLAAAAMAWLAFRRAGRQAGARLRAYAITDRRVLVHDGEQLQSFGPADLASLQAQQQPDGTWDAYWGQRERPGAPASLRRRQDGESTFRGVLSVPRRAHRIGLLGLPAAEPAQSLLRALRKRYLDGAAPVAPNAAPAAPAATAAPAASNPRRLDDAPAERSAGWQTLRESRSGFRVDVPTSWQVKVGTVKRGRFLGIRFEGPEPRWVDPATSGWNRLELVPDVDGTALRIDLDPDAMPASLEEVLASRWARALNMKLLGSEPEVRAAGLKGFSATHSLKGVGLGVGALKIGGSMKADLIQRQVWLAGPAHSLHLIIITPAESDALRETMSAVVASMRLDSPRGDG